MQHPGFIGDPAEKSTNTKYWLPVAREYQKPVQVTPSQISLPIYGNHCGPGFGDPNVAPVDAVDTVCYRHDRCYERQGYFECSCDRALITSMPNAILQTPSAAGKVAGAGVMSYFSVAPCLCYPRLCLPFIGCISLPPVPGVGGLGPC